MSFTLLSIVLLGVMALFIYKQVTKGYKQGLTKSLINLSVLIICALCGALLASWIAALFSPSFIAFIRRTDIYVAIIKFTGDISIVEGFVIRIILSLILYLPIFLLLRKISSSIVRRILKKRIEPYGEEQRYISENENFLIKNDKKIGAILGVVSGFVLSIAIFMPLVGLLRSANDAILITKEITNVKAIEESEDLNLLDRYANDFSVHLIYACGGSTLYDVATTVSIDGELTCVNKEIKHIRGIDFSVAKGVFKESFAIEESKVQEINGMISDINESAFMKAFSVQIIKNTSSRWLQNKGYAGFKRPALKYNSDMNALVDDVLRDLSNTSLETYDDDIKSALMLISVVEKNHKIFENSDYTTFMRELENSSLLQDINNVTATNSGMASVNDGIDDIMLTSLIEELADGEKYTDVARIRLCNDLQMAVNKTKGLTKEARVSAMLSYSAESFATFGIDVSNSLNRKFATRIVDRFSDESGLIDSKDVEQFFNEYL